MRKIDRFDKYMKYKGLNDNKVTVQLNLSVGQLGKSRKEGRDLSDKVIELILNFYTDLDRVWLLTGSGNMLKSEPQPSTTESSSLPPDYVLLVPVSAQGGTLNEFEVSVKDNDCEKVISPIRGIDYAVSVSGDSMSPEYPNGSRVFIKKINEKAFIEWGKVYVLDTCNGTVIKILAPSDDPGKIRCLSINPDPIYAPFEVSLEDVNGIYRVLLCMSVK